MTDLPLSIAFAIWLDRYLKSRGIGQAAAARFIGLTRQEMNNRIKLRTRFSLDEVGELVTALHIDLDDMVREIEEMRARAAAGEMPKLPAGVVVIESDPDGVVQSAKRASNEV